jgi:hypothetical protein
MIYKNTRPEDYYWRYCKVLKNKFYYFNADESVQMEDDGKTPCIHIGTPPEWYQPMEFEVAKKIMDTYILKQDG